MSKLNPRLAGTLAIALSVIITAAMWHAPVTVQFGIAFALPVFLCAWTRNRTFLWTLTVCIIAISIAKIIISDKPVHSLGYFYANRIISIVTTLICAGMVHLLIRLIDSFEAEHERLRTTLSTVPVGVAIADARLGTMVFNVTASKLFSVEPDHRYDLNEMIQKYEKTQTGPDDEAPVARALRGEHVQAIERHVSTSDGRALDLLISAAPLRDTAGRIIGAVSGFVDITQQKSMQRALDDQRRLAEEQSDRKSRFLAAVSHDIRTPANAINLLAELIERSSGSESLAEDLPEIARDMKSSATSLVRLVSDVLDLTRYDQGRVDLSPTDFPLVELFEDECRQFAQVAKDKGVEFVCNMPSESLVIRADRVKLSRVVGNLVGNAVKFTREGKIILDADQNNGHLLIRVSDTGPGIHPQHHHEIFDEYFQIKNPNRDHEKGSGLGLAICKRLTQAMNAKIEINSKPGDGSTFTVQLPGSCVVRQ